MISISNISHINVQAVDHPYLVVYSQTAVLKAKMEAEDDDVEQVCGLCHDPVEDGVVSSSFPFY